MRRIILLGFILLMFCCITSCAKEEKEVLSLEKNEGRTEQNKQENSTVYVHVCGAVIQEGVYELPKGSRVYEAIEKAGGFRADAATTEVNQAEELEDGMRLYVPTVNELIEAQSKKNGKININKASKEELMTLPGVGESKAERIIQYRKERGAFKKTEEIMNISGIKEGLYNKIKDYISV